jgi:hypothetical protein
MQIASGGAQAPKNEPFSHASELAMDEYQLDVDRGKSC